MDPTSTNKPLSVGIDATPLFGQPTGVGAVSKAVVDRLSVLPEIDLTLVLVSWKAKQLLTSQSLDTINGMKFHPLRFPARAVHRLWQHIDRPAVTGFDVVHGTNFVSPPANGGAELVTIHDLAAWRMPELVSSYSLAYPKLVERALRRGAHIHAVSQAIADEVIATISIEPDRVHTISNGFEGPSVDLMGEGKAALADSGRNLAGGSYILCLGTIEPRKDHPGLLAAMKTVWTRHPEIKLVVAGGDGWGAEAYDQAIIDLGLVDDHRIVRLGYVTEEDRLKLLAGAECLAYPSLYEGFGLPPLEAMALDTPVVSTDIPAVAEVCGDAAILVPTRDDGALAAGLIEVLEGAGDRLRSLGRMRTKKYDWDRSVDELVALYHQLAAGD